MRMSNVEDNISSPLNRGGFPFFRTLLAIHQKSPQLRFQEEIHFFVWVVYASLAASRTFLQRVLASLKFTLDLEDLFCW